MILTWGQTSRVYALCDYYEGLGIETFITLGKEIVSVTFLKEGEVFIYDDYWSGEEGKKKYLRYYPDFFRALENNFIRLMESGEYEDN